MPIDQETKSKIIDAYFDQRKTIRDVSNTVGKSSRDGNCSGEEAQARVTTTTNGNAWIYPVIIKKM